MTTMLDCSDVIPVPTGTVQDPFVPAGLTLDDLQPACSSSAFPTVTTVAGAFVAVVLRISSLGSTLMLIGL